MNVENGRSAFAVAAHDPDAAGVEPSTVDARKLRTVFGTFATGVTVLTVGGALPRGMTANSFTSVSLEPPLVLICVDRDAKMHASLVAAGTFAVSVLSAHQEPIARHFASSSRAPGMAQFEAVSWVAGARTGAPLISDALAWFECALWRTYVGGDHTIFVGRLLSHQHAGPDADVREALVFHSGRFRQLRREAS